MWGPNNGAWRIPLDASGNWTHIDDNVKQLASDNDSLYAPMFNDVPGFRLRNLSRIREPAVRAANMCTVVIVVIVGTVSITNIVVIVVDSAGSHYWIH